MFRLKLPTTQIDKSQVSVWDMVKHFIGKVYPLEMSIEDYNILSLMISFYARI